jgi:hypothetical protein
MVDLQALVAVLLDANGELTSVITPEIETSLLALGLQELLDHAREVCADDEKVVEYIVRQVVAANKAEVAS